MPNLTFLNFSEERRQQILSVCLREFEDKSLNQVKVADIIQALKVSRGTFYKYFTDLDDLYHYLLDDTALILHEKIVADIHDEEDLFFEGIQRFLLNFLQLEKQSDTYRGMKLLVLGEKLPRTYNPEIAAQMRGLNQQWQQILTKNAFQFSSREEAMSFLRFTMEIVIDLLSDYFVYRWPKERLLQEYAFRTQWLKNGIFQKSSQTNN